MSKFTDYASGINTPADGSEIFLVTVGATITGGGTIASGGVSFWVNTDWIVARAQGAAGAGAAQTIEAAEAITAPAFVNIYDDSGTARVRNADASTTGKEADGFVLASVAMGGDAAVYAIGVASGFSGLTPGEVFLDPATPGGATATAPSTSGQTLQSLGKAISATAIIFQRGAPIAL